VDNLSFPIHLLESIIFLAQKAMNLFNLISFPFFSWALKQNFELISNNSHLRISNTLSLTF